MSQEHLAAITEQAVDSAMCVAIFLSVLDDMADEGYYDEFILEELFAIAEPDLQAYLERLERLY